MTERRRSAGEGKAARRRPDEGRGQGVSRGSEESVEGAERGHGGGVGAGSEIGRRRRGGYL